MATRAPEEKSEVTISGAPHPAESRLRFAGLAVKPGTGASWLSPIMSRGALQVLIKRGEGLPKADLNGLADPYVRVTVRHMTRETTVVKECLDPVWDEPLQFLGPLEEFRNDELILKNKAAEVLMSCCHLGASDAVQRLAQQVTMTAPLDRT